MITNNSESTLAELSSQFHLRHDFNSQELKVLKARFPKAKIEDIPTAWIYIIDIFLHDMFSLNPDIKISISQKFGLLLINWENGKGFELRIQELIDLYESKIYEIDKDLHKGFKKLISVKRKL